MPERLHVQESDVRFGPWLLQVCRGCGSAAAMGHVIDCPANCDDIDPGVLVEVVPRSEAEALAVELERVFEDSPVLHHYRLDHPKETP